jgi:hypothetical protein
VLITLCVCLKEATNALEPQTTEAETNASERLTLRPPFEVKQVAETGHEVRNGDGVVFGWTGDRSKALVLAGLLEAVATG